MNPTQKKLVNLCILFAVLAILGIVHHKISRVNNKNGLKIGSCIPDFKYTDQNGGEHLFSKLGRQKACLLFLSLGCHACDDTLGNMGGLLDRFGKKIEFFLMVSQASKAGVSFIMDTQVKSKIYFVNPSEINRTFTENQVPRIYFINEDKRIVYKKQGYLELQEEIKLLNNFIGNSLVEPLKEKFVKINEGRIVYSENVKLQSSHNDCGIVAMQIVFNHFDEDFEGSMQLRQMEIKKKGFSMLELKEIAEKNGFHATGWKLAFSDLANSELPLIALVFNSHYVVIEEISNQEVFISDPEIGKVVYSKNRFFEIWKGEVLKIEGLTNKRI